MDASTSLETHGGDRHKHEGEHPPSHGSGAAGEHHELGWWRKYVFSTDHKVIGIQYGFTGLIFLFFGFSLMMLMRWQSEEHTSELQSLAYLVCRLLLEKKK